MVGIFRRFGVRRATICRRVEHWREIPRGDNGNLLFGIDTTAWVCDVEADAVLTWLRAGMPYAKEGDWETGEGFLLRPSWIIDWHLLVCGYAKLTGHEKLLRTLQMHLL